jgi:hypothetical protein
VPATATTAFEPADAPWQGLGAEQKVETHHMLDTLQLKSLCLLSASLKNA